VNVLDLFSGIGGFSLGLERAGMRTVAFCEIEPYCRAVLSKLWPGVPIFHDVRSVDAQSLASVEAIDVVCGGFPCQDLSVAGNRAGIDGERSGLWSELVRIFGVVRPRYAIVENVANLLAGPSEQPGQWFGRVLGDLAALGFDAEWHCIPASAVGALHRRDRVWIVAHAAGRGQRTDGRPSWEARHADGRGEDVADAARHVRPEREAGGAERERIGVGGQSLDLADAECGRLQSGHVERPGSQAIIPASDSWRRGRGLVGETWRAEPDVGRVAHGVPSRVDRLRALGNAVVPQVVEIIGRAIMSAAVSRATGE
jgi:DNA (cytosine-5)-methyltransferase 1